MATTIALAAVGAAGTTTLGGSYGFSNNDKAKPNNTVTFTIRSDDGLTTISATGTREQMAAWFQELLDNVR